MSFNSLDYFAFFFVFAVIYFLADHKHRWLLLLIASYIFYMSWKIEYVVLIIAATLTNYFGALKIYKSRNAFHRKLYLALSLSASFFILFLFKYFNFFSQSISFVAADMGLDLHLPLLDFLLPVGISFYTFQAVGYTVDVYTSKIDPEKNLGIFSLYISFFPQLVAGPIERAKNLIPQIKTKHAFDLSRVKSGIELILWGLFKKVVIADRLAIYVNEVYNHSSDYSGLPLLIATYFFTFQIYCDFSGYSDIAIGSAKILGFDLMTNFNRPYFAVSIRDFWRRWHISLSTWFRDYVYFPLGGSRRSFRRVIFNLLVVFAVSGLWHGANWTFIIWGVYHGTLAVLEIYWSRLGVARPVEINRFLPGVFKLIRILITFHLVCLGWVFFRANTISDALNILNTMPADIFNLSGIAKPLGARFDLFLCFSLIGALVLAELPFIKHMAVIKSIWHSRYARWAYYYSVLVLIALFGITEKSQFIYFQF